MIVKKLTEKLNKIKICAVVTAICFIVSTLGANLYALPLAENITQKYEDVFNKATGISTEYGKITSGKDANSNVTVINIQDLHCHPQTQRNISNIIKEIADKYNLTKIYVEGGYGNIDVSWLGSIKDENIRKQAIEKLLEEGILTGSEYYKLISNNDKVKLKGIDEEEIHKDNVKRLSWLIAQQDKYKEIIDKVTSEINVLEKIYVNGRNERFNKNIEEYLSNKTNSKKFYKQLIKYVRDINGNPDKYNNITAIRLEDYPNIIKFLSMATDSNKINVKKVKTELQELVLLLKNRLPFGVYSKLLKETNNFTDNQKSLELMNLLCEKENINLDRDFKEIAKLSTLNLNNKNFNPIQLVQEERQLISEIRKALSYNIEEYEITFISDFNKYFQDYLEYKLTDADWKYFENYYDRFRQIYSKYATVDRIKDIEQDFVVINKYYSINDQRNNIFVEKLLENEDIHQIKSNKKRTNEEILKDSKEVIIAVTGGFHSSELEKILSEKEVNTIVITPTVYGNIKQANEKYVDLIEEQSKINYQALSYTIASSITDIEKQKILLAVIKDIFGADVEKIKEILGKDIDLSLLDKQPVIDSKQKNKIRKIIENAVNQVIDVIPQQGMKDAFAPNIDKIMLNMATLLVKNGIYFSKGVIFDIEKKGINGEDLKGIPAEIYSRMLPGLQKALLAVAVDESKDDSDNEPPQLTMTALKKILDKTSFKRSTKIKIVSIIEAPIIMLGLIFPSVNNWFLKQHKVKDILDKAAIASGLEILNDDIKNTYFDSFISIKETVRIPLVRTIVAFSISIVKAFKANIKGHIEFNTIAYLVQSYKDFVGFDIKYSQLFKNTNLTTGQEKKIIRDILNLRDKFNANGSSKFYSDAEIVSMLQKFEAFEIVFFKKNKRPLYINSIINTPADLQKIIDLLQDLSKLNISTLETENNMLALKIFNNDVFNELINQSNIEYGKQSITQKYFIAIAVARYISQVLDGQPVNNQNFDEIVRVATETYIEVVENNENKTVVDENTKIIALSAPSDGVQHFNNNGIKKLLQKLNIPEEGANRTFLSSDMESIPKMKEAFLNMIANLNANDKQVFISFDGHGFEGTLVLNEFVSITNEELFAALRKAQENGFDLNNLTINLSSCESWFFAKSLYNKFDNLYKKLEKRNKLQSKSYPTIWTAAGHETRYGYTDNYYSFSTPLFDENGIIDVDADLSTTQVGNEWNAVLSILGQGQQTSLNVKDILRATLEAKEVNFTLFVSDKNIEQIYNKSAQKILELNSYDDTTKEEKHFLKGLNSVSLSQLLGIRHYKTFNFNRGYFELSIFPEADNIAHIWEEIAFRTLPISLAVIPITSFLPVPAILAFFIVLQVLFVRAHTVRDWKKQNNIKWSIGKTIPAFLFNIFPDEQSKEEFEYFAQTGQVRNNSLNRSLLTMVLSVPYIFTLFFAPNIPALILSTIIGMGIHKFFNSIFKDKLSIFETKTSKVIDLSTDEGKQTFFLLLGNKETDISDVVNRIDFNNEQQLLDLIKTIHQHYLYLDKPLQTFITELSKRINVNNEKELEFLRNIMDASIMSKEQIISDLIPKIDFNNPKQFDFMQHFILNKSIQTVDVNSKLIDRLDLGNKKHLELISSLSRFSDDIIFKLIEKLDFNEKDQLSVISNLIVNIGFSNTHYIINEILKKLNLNNPKDLAIFEKIVCNHKFRTEENFETVIELLNLQNPEHVKTVRKILDKDYFKIIPVFNSLVKRLNFNNDEHKALFQYAIGKVIAVIDKEIVVNDIFNKTIGSLVLEPQNSNFLIYARHQLLDALLKKLIRLRTENLVIANGLATIYLQNQTKLDSIKMTALRMKADIESLDDESIEKLNELLRNIELFENMQKKKTTIDDFAQQAGFSLLKPTPTTYLDGRRSTFTSVLRLLPKSLYDVKQHDTTFFMSKDSIDKNKLGDISVKFDAYMKLLDENLYVLNKFDTVTDFSSQFDDVVKHLNIMLDHLSVISESDAKIFRGILETIVEEIRSGKTTLEQQRELTEMKDNPFANVNSITTIINRIHQKASFDFLAKISLFIGKDNSIEHNIYLSRGKKTIGVYNLSEKPIHPDMKRLLIALNNDPDFSTDKNSNIFIKDNILLWTGLLGAHAVRVVIDFNEESRGILADFHEGMIDAGSYVRIAMLHKILSDIGFTIDDSTQKYQRYERLVGIVATLDKDTGLKNDSDFVDLAQKLIVLFDNAAAFNNSITKKSQIRQTIRVSVLRIMEIYSKMFYVGKFKNNRIYSTANTRKNLNKLLSLLDLPLIPKQEPGFRTNLKVGPFFAGKITTYGQNTIDKYINEPIERAFALGSIKLNGSGSLEKNGNYNPIASNIEKINEMLNMQTGNSQETEMLQQGAVLSQIPERDLNFETYGQIGNYILKTGYMKLVDGRLDDIKGEFIGVTVLVDKNGIIRYSSCELVGFPENMKGTSERQSLTYSQLKQLLESEGYEISPIEPLNNQELYTYREGLQQNIFNTGTPIAYGTMLSKPKGVLTRGVFATVDSDVYIDKYAKPENVGIAAQNKVSLFTGGSYSSHAGILLREYEKTAIIVNNSQIIETDKRNEIKIKFYIPKGSINTINNLQTQEIEEVEVTLQKNDIVVIDTKNNKILLFPHETFKNANGQNILFELQKYIDNKDTENIKNFINRYKNNTELTERIIEYIYYQSSDNSWLEEFLTTEFKSNKKVVKVSGHSRVIKRNKIVIQKFLSHRSSNNVYLFGERDSLDATKVGTKSANQSKLFLLLEQLKKDTGIQNVAVPNGMVIGYDILEKLLGKEYIKYYQQLEAVIKNNSLSIETKIDFAQEIIAQIVDLIQNIPEEDIIKYIGKGNLELFKNNLAIVRSSGVGEDSKEYSAAGIAESFGQVEYENIPKAIKDTLLSFFSPKAIDYMINSANIIKPAVLVEEWIDADKAGIMMSEDSEGHRIIQVINGKGEDIVSGRISPYSFILDIQTGKKIDGNYTNDKTLSKENLEKLTKIMEWLEQVEGVPVDIEFVIKNNVIYIVQVRPITTIGARESVVPASTQKAKLTAPIVQSNKIIDKTKSPLSATASIWEEIAFRFIPAFVSILALSVPVLQFITIPLSFIFFVACQKQFIKAHNIRNWIRESHFGWSTEDVLKTTLFNKFKTGELKELFDKFKEQQETKEENRQRTLATMLLSAPYVYSMLFAPTIPVVIIATIIGIIAHNFFNYILPIKLDIFDGIPKTPGTDTFENIDLTDKTNLQSVQDLLSSDMYNTGIGVKLIEQIDFSDDAQLNLLYALRFVNDEIMSKILQKANLGNIKHLSLILKLLPRAGYLLSFQSIFTRIINNINLNDKNALKDFSRFIINNNQSLDDDNIGLLMKKLNLNNNEHIKLLEFIVQNNNMNTDLIFDILINSGIDLNDNRYDKVFRAIIDKMLSKYKTYKDAKKYLKSNILNLPANTNQGKYAFSKLIDLLHRDLIAHQNRYLKMVNGRIVLRVNENGVDPIFNNIKDFAKELSVQQQLFDKELRTKFNELINDITFFEKMETSTSRKIYAGKHKIIDSLANNVTIEEFCKEKGFDLIKQTPGIFFDSKRYTFTNILNLLSKKVLRSKINKHYSTYIMTRDSIDAENLNDINKKFDTYMKLLDENLYVLNKFGEVVDFSAQFDDVVNHINLMIDYLEQINSSAALSFRKILKNILDDIQNNRTTLSEQRNIIEAASATSLLDGITTIGTLINRIHQNANFSFVTNIMGTIEDYEDAGHNILISKNDNLIPIYNLSTTNLNPEILRFLSELANNPDFSTGVRTPIFIKDNIFLWVAQLGAHSVRILADFNEDSKSILVDFHEAIIDEGSNVRLKILSRILRRIGFNIKISHQQFADGTTLPVGVIATIDKNNGLTTGTDFNGLLKQAAVLFNNASSLNNLTNNRIKIRENVNVAKLEIMDIYSRFYSIGLIEGNFIKTVFNSRRNFNRILKSLDLPLIPRKEQGFWTFLKIGFLRIPIKTYGQKTIDKYINKPIEQGFAQGSLRINNDGVLERNKEYNPLISVADKLTEILEQKPGNITEIEMLSQGALISQIPQHDLNLTTVGQIGGYVLKTGHIKLVDGKFLALTTLIDGNGIIRYSSTELVGTPEQMNSNTTRINLNLNQLQQVLETEGYKITSIEALTDFELLNYRSKLQESITTRKTLTAYGTLISTPKQKQIRSTFGIINGQQKENVYIDKYASPENVGTSAQYRLSLFTSGSYASHAGIVLREYGKTAMVVNDSQIIDNKMKIKFYQPQGDIQKYKNLEIQKIEESEIELQQNDIVLADIQNNKLLLFPNKQFKVRGVNVLLELQKYIDNKNAAKIQKFLNKYKDNKLIDLIIEYIHYQAENNAWLNEVLPETIKVQQSKPTSITEQHSRQIIKKVIQITKYVKHIGNNTVYKFGERESLDATKVGTKSANQSKLFLLLEQLKKDTGIQNVTVPNGMVIGYDILEKLLGEQYVELYKQLEAVITGDLYDAEEKYSYSQYIVSQIRDLIQNIPEEEILKYIGKENIEIFKNNLSIVRSSGVGEDSKEYSAAGIAESFGQIEYGNIPKAVKDTLLSFFSPKAIDYMAKSSNIIKPAVLIEEWIDADKAGIMMSEDSQNHRIIQIINGQGEDIVSGRITPYSFTVDIKTGKKIDGDYNNEKTVSKENLEKLIKIMEWLEQVEGVPVDIEFLIKDNIIYIVQVRPITTLNKQQTIATVSPTKKLSIFESLKELGRPLFDILDFTAPVWEEVAFRSVSAKISLMIVALPFSHFITIPLSIAVFTLSQISFVRAHLITDWLKTKDSGWLNRLSTNDILKATFLGKLPDQQSKNGFKQHSKNPIVIQYRKSLVIHTLFLSAIYIGISLTSLANPILAATIVAIIIHAVINATVELLETLRPINKNLKIQQTGIDKNFISFAENNGADIISIYDLPSKVRVFKKHMTPEVIPTRRRIDALHFKYWQQIQKLFAKSAGFSLGLTTVSISDDDKNKANIIEAISNANGLISWEDGYDYFYGNTYIDERIVPVEEYVQTIISSCIRCNKHIYFFLPSNFMDMDTKTRREFEYIQKFLQNNPDFANYFTFVVGAYDFVKINNNSVFQKYFNTDKQTAAKTIKKLLSFPKIFMIDSFISEIFISRKPLSIFGNKVFISLFKNNQFFTDKELKILNDDSETEGYIDIYLDDDIATTKQRILEAATNNKLIVLHMFKNIASLQTKNLREVYREISKNISVCLGNNYGLNDIFPAMTIKEVDFQGNRYGYNLFLEEIIKNAFVHGYNGLLDQPIGIAIKLNNNKEVQEILTYTKKINNLDVDPLRTREMEDARLNGYGLGKIYMEHSYLRSYEENPMFGDDNNRFFKVKSVLYDTIDETKKSEFERLQQAIAISHTKGFIVLPENMKTVNTMLHQGKRALGVAWKIAKMEADSSFEQDEFGKYTFAQRHQSILGKQGAIELINFIEKMQNRTKWLTKISPYLAKSIVRQSSIVKHLIIDYRTIKASGITQAIELFGKNATLNEEGQVNVCILEDIEQLDNGFTLINTGIKIDGVSIYRIKNSDLLIYGAKGKTSIKVAQLLDGTKELKKALKEIGIQEMTNIDTDSVVWTQGQGIEFNNGLLEIGEFGLTGKSSQEIKEFITSAMEVKRALGIMYGQKTIIDLHKLSGQDLIKAIENGRARKVLTEQQFKDLKLSKEKISELKESGIEIYILGNEIKNEYMEIGISGQIIRDEQNNKSYIYDYYSMDKTELDEIKTAEDFAELEDKIINGDKLIIIDIEILKKNFQGSNPIEAFSKLGALTGKMKISMGLGNITIKDIENIGYNIRFEQIPEISSTNIQALLEATNKEEIINIIGDNNEFSIILKSLDNKHVNRFKAVIIERILSKKALTDSATALEGIELQDKNLERLLGKLLLRQINYTDKETTKDGLVSQGQLMKTLELLKELDNKQTGEEIKEQQELVNTIILLILFYDGQRVKGKLIQEQSAINDISKYRAMLSAA